MSLEETLEAINKTQKTFSDSITELVSKLSQASLSTTILQINPPEFSDGPDSDVYEWLDQFERTTLGLPTDQKCQLLEKAFTGTARSWYRDELQTTALLKNWSDVRETILKRYSGRDNEERYLDKLSSLKYNPLRHASLSSFADEYIHVYSKAHPSAEEKDTVKALIRSIPAEFRGYLNLVKRLSTIDTTAALKDTLRYYDQDIKIYHPKEEKETLDLNKFKDIMTDVVKTMVEQQAGKTEEVIAAFMKKNDYRQNQRPANRTMTCYGCNQVGHIRRYCPNNGAANRTTQQVTDNQNSSEIPSRQQGPRPPPSACRICNEWHWVRDCPHKRNQDFGQMGC